jgi:uncharacterized protein (TIGR02757 family)
MSFLRNKLLSIHPSLKIILDQLYNDYSLDHLQMDPLELVRRYDHPQDQEIVGLIAAFLAVGQVDLIRQSVGHVLSLLGDSPGDFVLNYNPVKNKNLFNGFQYRFYKGEDLHQFIWWMQRMLLQEKTIEQFFLRGYNSGDSDIGQSLSIFVQAVLSLEPHPFYSDVPEKGYGIRHFLADPQDGSGCKRLNLFLRWMVRKDDLDLGLWHHISPSQLIIPLDVHIARLGVRLGLTNRKSADWKMAKEITESLRAFDPDDPVKYDFALCKVGMLYRCLDRYEESLCSDCPLVRFCSLS